MTTAAVRLAALAEGTGLPHLHTQLLGRSLDFYLLLGCRVREVSDGRVLLGCGPVSFLLSPLAGSISRPRTALPELALTAPDLPALRRRLLAAGFSTSDVDGPDDAPGRAVEVLDPDGHRVLIGRAAPVVAGGRLDEGPLVSAEPCALTAAHSRPRPVRLSLPPPAAPRPGRQAP